MARPFLQEPEKVSGPGEEVPQELKDDGMTLPEYYCYWALVNRLHWTNGVEFQYRTEVRYEGSDSGSAQLDFLIYNGSRIAFEVQGGHWHYGLGREKITQDVYRRAALLGQGWKVIFIDEDDALRNPEFYVREALRGVEHSFIMKPYFVP